MSTRSLALGVRVPLLEWLPGETFYSLCSRHHRFSGFSTSADTTQALFGHRRSGSQHDFPSRLDVFAERTEGVHGGAAQIALGRTVLAFYAPFHMPSVIEDAVLAMRSESVAHLKYRLGLLTSRFRANHPLKACPKCVDECVRTHGWSCWQLEHQQPGVWMCRHHEEPLLTSSLKATGVERFSWQLPDEGTLRSEWFRSAEGSDEAHFRLSNFIHELKDCGRTAGWLLPIEVQRAFRRRFNKLGLLTPGGNVRAKEVRDAYAKHCVRLRSVPELAALPNSVDEAAAEVGRLVRTLRTGTHPIRLMVMATWLFETAADFAASLSLQQSEIPKLEDEGPVAEDPRRLDFLRLVTNGASVRRAGELVGVSANTGIAWAASTGIAVSSRPKTLKPELRDKLVKLLRRGCDRTLAAEKVGVAVGTVDRLFQKQPDLHIAWHEARRAKAQRDARAAWTRALAGAGIKLARALEPAAFAWLYRNDRLWLRLCENPPGDLTDAA